MCLRATNRSSEAKLHREVDIALPAQHTSAILCVSLSFCLLSLAMSVCLFLYLVVHFSNVLLLCRRSGSVLCYSWQECSLPEQKQHKWQVLRYAQTSNTQEHAFQALFCVPFQSITEFHCDWQIYTTRQWKWPSFGQRLRSFLIFPHPKQTRSHGSRHIQGWCDAHHFLLLRTTSESDISVTSLLSPNRKFISNCEILSVLTNAFRRMEMG